MLELEFKTTFAGGIGEGFDLTSEEEATTIKDDGLDLGVRSALCDQLANCLGSLFASSSLLD